MEDTWLQDTSEEDNAMSLLFNDDLASWAPEDGFDLIAEDESSAAPWDVPTPHSEPAPSHAGGSTRTAVHEQGQQADGSVSGASHTDLGKAADTERSAIDDLISVTSHSSLPLDDTFADLQFERSWPALGGGAAPAAGPACALPSAAADFNAADLLLNAGAATGARLLPTESSHAESDTLADVFESANSHLSRDTAAAPKLAPAAFATPHAQHYVRMMPVWMMPTPQFPSGRMMMMPVHFVPQGAATSITGRTMVATAPAGVTHGAQASPFASGPLPAGVEYGHPPALAHPAPANMQPQAGAAPPRQAAPAADDPSKPRGAASRKRRRPAASAQPAADAAKKQARPARGASTTLSATTGPPPAAVAAMPGLPQAAMAVPLQRPAYAANMAYMVPSRMPMRRHGGGGGGTLPPFASQPPPTAASK